MIDEELFIKAHMFNNVLKELTAPAVIGGPYWKALVNDTIDVCSQYAGLMCANEDMTRFTILIHDDNGSIDLKYEHIESHMQPTIKHTVVLPGKLKTINVDFAICFDEL